MAIYRFDYKPMPEIVLGKGEQLPLCLAFTESGEPAEKASWIPSLPLYGVEVEFELPDESKAVKREIFKMQSDINKNMCYLKHDGSLKNGLEIVTHPRSFKAWQETKVEFKNFLKKMRAAGYRSYSSGRCGLHIHVGLTSFTGVAHVLRFVSFFHGNAKFCRKISGRAQESINQFCYNVHPKWIYRNYFRSPLLRKFPRNTLASSLLEPGQIEFDRAVNDHHSAANITNHTVEVRIFRGTLNHSRIFGIIEFLEAVRQYTAINGNPYPDAGMFLKWVSEQPGFKDAKRKVFNKFFKDKARIGLVCNNISSWSVKISKTTKGNKRLLDYIKNSNEAALLDKLEFWKSVDTITSILWNNYGDRDIGGLILRDLFTHHDDPLFSDGTTPKDWDNNVRVAHQHVGPRMAWYQNGVASGVAMRLYHDAIPRLASSMVLFWMFNYFPNLHLDRTYASLSTREAVSKTISIRKYLSQAEAYRTRLDSWTAGGAIGFESFLMDIYTLYVDRKIGSGNILHALYAIRDMMPLKVWPWGFIREEQRRLYAPEEAMASSQKFSEDAATTALARATAGHAVPGMRPRGNVRTIPVGGMFAQIADPLMGNVQPRVEFDMAATRQVEDPVDQVIAADVEDAVNRAAERMARLNPFRPDAARRRQGRGEQA